MDRFGLENSSLGLGWKRRGDVKTSRFTEARIAFVLRRAEDGTAIGEVCRRAGLGEATFHDWRKRYAGLMPSEMGRLKRLGEVSRKRRRFGGNGRLEKLAADLSLTGRCRGTCPQKSCRACAATRPC